MVQEAERRRRTTIRTLWWEQPMDMDVASVEAPTVVAAEEEGGGRARRLAADPDARAT